MGAVRAPMLAKFWASLGYDLRVIAVENPAIKGMIEMPIPAEQVTYAPFDPSGGRVGRTVRAVKGLVGIGGGATGGNGGGNGEATAIYTGRRRFQRLRRLYQHAVEFPDKHWSWIDPAVAAGLKVAETWQPDVVYSSAPPHSGHIVAQRLAGALNVPWIAELRDPWATNLHDDVPALVRPFRRRVAIRTLRHATACVTLSDTLGREVAGFTGKPTTVSYNGFGRDDFAGLDDVPPHDAEHLTIIHAGAIYAERRDPSPLFQALATLGGLKGKVRVIFYHDEHGWVLSRAQEFGVGDCVEMRAPVPRKQILELERAVDVLLMCRWDDPGGDGIIPGKLFEYIGARRPVLSVGSCTGEAADILRSGDFGLVENAPERIADGIRHWLAEKSAHGGKTADLPREPTVGYLRETQFEKVDALIRQVAAGDRPAHARAAA